MGRVWLLLCLAWIVGSADRAVTGPVIAWMIRNHAGFMAAPDPYALGGLIGGIFFAGYMLAQFPGGYVGDRHGHRGVIAISLFWAAAATLLSGLAGALIGFVALRIATGIGEGLYYANDRALLAASTPERRRSLGMGVVITGLAIGITVATALTPPLIRLGAAALGAAEAWRMPFFALGATSAAIAALVWRGLGRAPGEAPARAFAALLPYALVAFALVFGLFLLARAARLPPAALTAAELALALGTVAFVWRVKGAEIGAAVASRDLVLLYLSFVPVLWTLWFLGFWSVAIVSSASGGSFQAAALTAMFVGLAGMLGFPAGGFVADRARRAGVGRKPALLCFTLAVALLTLALARYLQAGGRDARVLAALLFTSGLFFSALQPVAHALVADLAPPARRGAAFGTYNLIGETGAVLGPALSGALRDATGGWAAAVYLDGALMLASALLVLGVRERLRQPALPG